MRVTILLAGLFLGVLSWSAPLQVGVSVLPLESITEVIGGDEVRVQSLQREGDSCSVFEPRPSSISWLARAEIFFRVGAGYESAILEKVDRQFAGLHMVDLRETVSLIEGEPGHHHGHDHAHGHGHEGCAGCAATLEGDPHIWLDPLQVISMGQRMAKEMGSLRPELSDTFAGGAEALEARALDVHQQLSGLLEPYRGRAFYVYHPALAYFARRYGLEQVSIAGGSGEPSPKELHRLIRQAREAGVRSLFVQPQENRKHAQIVAEAVGATLVEIDPMAREWDTNLLQVGEALAAAFAED